MIWNGWRWRCLFDMKCHKSRIIFAFLYTVPAVYNYLSPDSWLAVSAGQLLCAWSWMLSRFPQHWGSVIHAFCHFIKAPTDITVDRHEINNGREANILGNSNASSLNLLPGGLEAELNFVHLFHEHLPWSSLSWFPNTSFQPPAFQGFQRYPFLLLFSFIFTLTLSKSGDRTALLGSSTGAGAHFTH